MRNNIGLFLSKRAHLNPTMEALVDVSTGRRLNYREIDLRSNKVANAVCDLGVRKGDRVAILMMNGVEYFESFTGLAKIGAVVVPLNWRLVADELSYILKDAGATTLIYGSEFSETVCDLYGRSSDGTNIVNWVEFSGEGLERDFFDGTKRPYT